LLLCRLYQIWLIPFDVFAVISGVLFPLTPKKSLSRKSVVIVGGGFAGSTVARALEDQFEVTLIDTKKYFEFTPSVLRALVEPGHAKIIQRPHLHYLQKANFIHDQVTAVGSSSVTTSREHVPYDYLVLCTGASYSTIPGDHKGESLVVSARANPLNAVFPAVTRARNVLIVGAGTVGVELAAEIKERFPSKEVILVGPILARSPARASRYAEEWLRSHGITLMPRDKISSYDGNSFFTAAGQTLQADCAFICTGNLPNTQFIQSSKELSSALNERGFARVNEHLQMEGWSNVFVAGDITYIPGEDEKLCQDALVQGAVIARNIRQLERRSSKLGKYSACKRPMLISLGKYDCILVYRGWTLCGFFSALMKEFVEWKEMLRFQDSLLSLNQRMRYSKHQHIV